MDIIAILGQLQNKISELQTALSDTEAALANVAKENYDKGFEDGKASMGEPDGKLYSQEEMDAAINPLKEQLSALQSELESAKADVDAKVKAAVEAFKGELKAKYAEQQSKEALAEKDFGDMLDAVEVPSEEPVPAEEPVDEEAKEEEI